MATLEMLIHLDDALLLEYSYVPAQIPTDLIIKVEDLTALPKEWRISPAPLEMQKIGDEWAKNNISVVLVILTSIIPLEKNYLLNQLHPDFAQIKIGDAKDFTFDEKSAKK